jgi:toxin ParE1/3/4
MNRIVAFHPMAERDLDEATVYYSAETSALGRAFLDDIEHALGHILDYPESAPLVNEVVRKKLLRRFPYNILYSVRPDSIRILAVANQKRRPFYWRDRI